MNLFKEPTVPRKSEAEGGCGVIGLACAEKIAGRHLLPSLAQMCNRGNGKGGGIAAAGLSPSAFGISQDILDNDYLLAIAYLDRECQSEVERDHILPVFDIDHVYKMPHIQNYKSLKDLDVLPPEAVVYFVRVKNDVVQSFRKEFQPALQTQEAIEDEIVYRNSYSLNRAFYSASGEKQAFVLSHGKNLLILKMVGFGNDVISYYKLEDFQAHVWIGHHRYPTKGKVWHPGGAHPFIGMHEALVHNGDFANYFSICEYLAQRNIYPLFLTDTEVSVLLFDLLNRIYRYPLEYVIEALAPTTERDFTLLPEDKQRIYQMIQKTHMHGSPDGPWFFLIAQSLPLYQKGPGYRLIGITDTSMLRPQVFALQNGTSPIGLAASEKQAIDATLNSLAKEDGRFWPCADHYWNARGGSYTDGGAFSFTVHPEVDGKATLSCTDKFGHPVHQEPLKPSYTFSKKTTPPEAFPDLPSHDLLKWIRQNLTTWNYEQTAGFLAALNHGATSDSDRQRAIEVTTKLVDIHYPSGQMRRSSLTALYNQSIADLLESLKENPTPGYAFLSFDSARPRFENDLQTLVIDARGYPSEGEQSLAREIVDMHKQGFKKFIVFHCLGQRFIGNGLGPGSQGVQINVYGSSGDYLASGIDGAEVHVHGFAQDQLAQIMNDGCLVVHGDVGQAFMYGAKGGKAFIRGNTAGRPMINAVGKPRVVINGTSLDYLAESFMAGNPLKGGGFVIVNGLAFDGMGRIEELDTPYPGSNLFSLASGGAIYIRDPDHKVAKEQLNGGEFTEAVQADWELVLPYLEENAQLFDIPVDQLLEHKGKSLEFQHIYRKISPIHVRVLQEEEAWVKGKD